MRMSRGECYVPRPFHAHSVDGPSNIRLKAQVTKLRSISYITFQFPCHLFPLRYKYATQFPVT